MTWLPKSVVCLRYYDRFRFRSDLFASSVLALQIFPIAIAIAIASGLSPLYGVSCAAIATLVASAFGDSKVRISGPSVLLIAAVSSIVTRYGALGLSLATLSAGLLLAFFGAIGLGGAIQILPRPVIAGFSTGLAVLAVTKQLPDLFGVGLRTSASEAGWGLQTALSDFTQLDLSASILGLASLVLIVASRRTFRHIPAGLVMMAVGAMLVRLGHLPVRTLSGSTLVSFELHSPLALKPDLFGSVLLQSLAIAVLVAVESLRATGIASAFTAENVNANGELLVQGGANLASALVGGLPTCGISSHSSDNALLGAQTPMAGILQPVFLVGFLFLLAPFLSLVPLPVISALILSSVCSMTEWGELPQVIRSSRKGVVAWLVIAVLIVFDFPAGIAVGLLVGMFLHVRKQRTVHLGETL